MVDESETFCGEFMSRPDIEVYEERRNRMSRLRIYIAATAVCATIATGSVIKAGYHGYQMVRNFNNQQIFRHHSEQAFYIGLLSTVAISAGRRSERKWHEIVGENQRTLEETSLTSS